MNGREGGREGETGWYWAIKPESDTQSASHALAQAIVVWNLRNAFDRFGVSVWVLFWMTPGDKTATREGKERRGRRGRGQGLPDEYVYFHSTFEKPACSVFLARRMEALSVFTQKPCTLMKRKKTQYGTVSLMFVGCEVSNRLRMRNIPVHIVWMTEVKRRTAQRYFIWLCILSASLLTQRESHLFSLTSAFL